jgi:hypothetical protein
MEQIVAA